MKATLPRITVACVIPRDDAFLLVEEQVRGRRVINQPAGHLEAGESLLAAAVRETREETGWTVTPTHLLGIYQWQVPRNGRHVIRVGFVSRTMTHDPDLPLDEGIIATRWLSIDQLRQGALELRSPMVLRCVEDYLAGQRYPLDLLKTLLPV